MIIINMDNYQTKLPQKVWKIYLQLTVMGRGIGNQKTLMYDATSEQFHDPADYEAETIIASERNE